MSISGTDLRKGDVILMDGILYSVMKAEHRTMGRKAGFIQVVFRNIKDGTQKDMKISSTDKLDRVDLFEKDVQFLYADGETYHFMDVQSYDQFELTKDFLGDKAAFLTDGMSLRMTFYETSPISVKLPQTMDFEIIEADPEIKGATATAQYKHAKISNGLDIKVPGFVNVGDRVKVNTETLEYQERVK